MALVLESATLDPFRRDSSLRVQPVASLQLAQWVESGRLCELCGPASVSAVTTIVSRAQHEGEPVVWVQSQRGSLFVPDLFECGIDLEALVIVHVPERGGPHGPIRASELLLRSGAFGLVIVDLRHFGVSPRLGPPTVWQGRLLGLAREHDAKVVLLSGCLFDPAAREESLGPLIGIRVESRAVYDAQTRDFRLEHHVLKNKSGAPVSVSSERRRGPLGLL